LLAGERMTQHAAETSQHELSDNEQAEAEDRKHPRAQVLYEAVRLEGEHELERPSSALAWSGLAAGMSMGFSLVAMGLLRAALPDAPWAKLIVNLGYSVGFLIIIVGRQQLFTENSLTPIIPLLQKKDASTLLQVLRLWLIVLVTNLVGTLAFAFVVQRSDVFAPEVKDAFAELGRKAMTGGFATHFLRAIFAGWLIALMMWLLAGADARAFLVVLLTYVIGVGELSHIVAGSCEAFYSVFNHDLTVTRCLSEFLLPVGIGNMLGGVGLVALLAHAQVAADAK
jgi:formate-nitrite transporter family protein